MRTTEQFLIADGYKEVRREEWIPLADAELLRTKAQRSVTSARREGERVLLEKHRILCPCCGCGTPAYERFLYPYVYGWRRHPGNEIDTWMQQDSFFEDGGKVLVLNTPVSPDDKFECPRCGFSSATEFSRFFKKHTSYSPVQYCKIFFE